ncbi:MAG: GIY-YIG nuclease family protein [Clostridia bacterium]
MDLNKKYHYFYKITNKINNHFYYGIHSTDNLNDNYMGSGKRLHIAYKEQGKQNFYKEIIKFFDSRNKAEEYERLIVNEELICNENCYNCIIGGSANKSLNYVTVIDKDGNTFNVHKNHPLYLNGTYVGVTKNKIVTKDTYGNYVMISVNDERYLKTHFPVTYNTVCVIDDNGKLIRVNKNDERYLNGELLPYNKGMSLFKNSNGDHKMLYVNDERVTSGEFVGITKDIKRNPEIVNKIKNTFSNIQHQQGEKNSQYGTCWITNDIINKKIKKTDLPEYITLGYRKGRII